VGIEHHLTKKNPGATDFVIVVIVIVIVIVVVVVVVVRGGVVCGVPGMKPNEIRSYKSHNLHYYCHTKHGTYKPVSALLKLTGVIF
jgi:hypothetical protein